MTLYRIYGSESSTRLILISQALSYLGRDMAYDSNTLFLIQGPTKEERDAELEALVMYGKKLERAQIYTDNSVDDQESPLPKFPGRQKFHYQSPTRAVPYHRRMMQR